MHDDHSALKLLAFFAGLALFCFVAWVAISAAKSDGRITYCYIHQGYRGYDVVGHREWRSDVYIANANSPEEADRLLRASAICSK